jgi:hypothetical protein
LLSAKADGTAATSSVVTRPACAAIGKPIKVVLAISMDATKRLNGFMWKSSMNVVIAAKNEKLSDGRRGPK